MSRSFKSCEPRAARRENLRATRGPQANPAGHAWPAPESLRATRGPQRVASGQSILRSHALLGFHFRGAKVQGLMADSPRFLVF